MDAARLAEACAAGGAARSGSGRWCGRDAALILTELPGQAPKLNAKAREVTGRRLRALGMELAEVLVLSA